MTQLHEILEAATRPFTDKRTNFCELAIHDENDIIMLTGSVLDQETITAVSDDLQTKLPQQTIDNSQVNILRQTEPTILTINTPITTLYATPGWLSEPLTQLLNGQAVECLQEKNNWVFVRQMDGYLGWVYHPYLSDTSLHAGTHWVCDPVAQLKSAPESDASLVSRILAGTAVSIQDEKESWAKIELTGGMTGWLPKPQLRPQNQQPQDVTHLRAQMIADAHTFIGVPYLWGGSSAYGIDCSGFAQLVHRLSSITLLRDADMQMENGRVVESSYQPGDLFFFGHDGAHRRISHVGMSLGGWQMIHASRSKNGVYIDDVQAVPHLRDTFLGARTYITPI